MRSDVPHATRLLVAPHLVLLIALQIAFLPCVRAAAYPVTDSSQVVGQDQTIVTVYEDTLYDLARKYGIGSEELIRANPSVDPWLRGAGKEIIIPGRHLLPLGPREGIVVNLPGHRLYYYPKPKRGGTTQVITYPVGIGKMDWQTPLGLTQVSQKEKNPIWYPPESIRKEHALAGDPIPAMVPAGPNNPLGLFALRLAVDWNHARARIPAPRDADSACHVFAPRPGTAP